MEIFPIAEQEKALVLFRWPRLGVEHATADGMEGKLQRRQLQKFAVGLKSVVPGRPRMQA
jgi:hypothetical protein